MESKKPRKILITGARSLVGSRFVELYKDKYTIITIGRSNDSILLDLLEIEKVFEIIAQSDVEVVINFAASTQVDACEDENNDKNGSVYTLNSVLPLRLAEACLASNKKLIHISTDYVVDGKKDDYPYKEDAVVLPVNSWYAKTKYWGEVNVINAFKKNGNFAVVRISYPYNGLYSRKLDFARVVISRLRIGENYSGTTDQKIKPISTDQIAKGLDILINSEVSGIYHLAGDFGEKQHISPYEFAVTIAKKMGLDLSLIIPVTFADFSLNRRAPRPKNTWLDTTKMQDLGMEFNSFDQEVEFFINQYNSINK